MQVFFTIASANYLASVRTLMQSLRAVYPNSERFVFAVDRTPPKMRGAEARVVAASEIGVPDFNRQSFGYTVLELNTAVKPWCFAWLAQRFPGARIVYFDPDIAVFRKLHHVDRAFADGAAIVLTPHLTQPLGDGFTPDDLTILKSGTYNLGFLGLRAGARDVDDFLAWWGGKLRFDAIVDIAGNKFTDQRWMDLAPSFVGDTRIVRHPGYNVAYWNLPHRAIGKGPRTGDWRAEGQPLYFFHFSGYSPAAPEVLSRHQNRLELADHPALAALFRWYSRALVKNGWEKHSAVEYSYGRFTSGRPIHAAMRRLLLEADRAGSDALAGDPFEGTGAWFDERDSGLEGDPGVTRLARAVWQGRADLRRVFDLGEASGRRRYIEWFGQRSSTEEGVDGISVAAAGELLLGGEPATPLGPIRPGYAIAWLDGIRNWLNEPFDGPAKDANGHFADTRWFADGTETIPLSRGLLLLLDARDDLVHAFVGKDGVLPAAYLTWALSTGLSEGLHPDWLSDDIIHWLTDVPPDDEGVPPLFRLLANCLNGNPYTGFRSEMDPTALKLLVAMRGRAMAHRIGLPPRLIERAFDRPASFAAESGHDDPPLPWMFDPIIARRPDVAGEYDTTEQSGRRGLVLWYLLHGARELGMSIADLGKRLLAWLDEFSSVPGNMPNGIELLAAAAGFSRAVETDPFLIRTRFETWFASDGRTQVKGTAFEEWLRLDGDDKPEPAVADERYGPLVLVGLAGSTSGRGEDLRMTSAALAAVGVPHEIADLRAIAKDGSDTRCVIVHLNADTAIQSARGLGEAFPNAYRIGYWAWELARFPRKWNSAFTVYDEVWCSTRFAYDAVRSSTDRPVRLMPMGVELPVASKRGARKAFGIPQSTYCFLYTFDLASYLERKNPVAAIRAFARAFPDPRQDVRLILKSANADHYPEAWAALRDAAEIDPRIDLRDALYSRSELTRLLGTIDCFVSPHRSEGFGRGPAEAMLLGKPLIVTGYSGNMDFCTERNCYLVDYELIDVGEGQYNDWEGQVWADVDVGHLAQLMAQVATHKREADAVGRLAQKNATAAFDKAVVGERMRSRLNSLPGGTPW